jgi:hypothetical protein
MNEQDLEAFIDASGACPYSARICALAAKFALSPASTTDIEVGRSLAARLISNDLTAASLLADVQLITGSSLFVHKEDGAITGVLGFFGVNEAGLLLMDAGGFDARGFDLGIVTRPGERPVGAYAFGVAASTKAGGSAIIRGSAAIQEALFWSIPIYTRVATEDGARVLLGGLGFAHVDNDPSLVRRPPRARPLEGYHCLGLAA